MTISRHTRLGLVGLASLLGIASLAPHDARGSIVFISRESRVALEGFGNGTPFGGEETFSGLGTFNESVSGQEGDAPDGTYARGNASQNTTINYGTGVGPLSGSGGVSVDTFAQNISGESDENHVTGESILQIIFEVSGNNEPFAVTGTFDILDIFGDSASFRLVRSADPGGGTAQTYFSADNDADLTSDEAFSSGNLSLPIGTYTLTARAENGSSGTGPGGLEPFGYVTGLTFQFTAGSGIDPPPPPPGGVIPLPAGVWAGMLGLTVAAGAVKKSRRSRAG